MHNIREHAIEQHGKVLDEGVSEIKVVEDKISDDVQMKNSHLDVTKCSLSTDDGVVTMTNENVPVLIDVEIGRNNPVENAASKHKNVDNDHANGIAASDSSYADEVNESKDANNDGKVDDMGDSKVCTYDLSFYYDFLYI